MFQFIHAADIHLDSPLRGLERYEGAPVEEIRLATRRAFTRLVDFALQKGVAFVIIAGDLFDTDWKDYNTGLFFAKEMSRLRENDIPVYVVKGNHDASNKITKSLPMPDNVHTFSDTKAETFYLDQCCVALHGQSFGSGVVVNNLALGYPGPQPGAFNIGVLHTSADGREGHATYAPCKVGELVAKGYDYWALGHVHKREVLNEDPLVIFPGNLQGRHIIETGPKGCTLVTVDDRNHATAEAIDLSVLRWEVCVVDVAKADTEDDVIKKVSLALSQLLSLSSEMPLAVRLELVGACLADATIRSHQEHLLNQIRAVATDVSRERIWVEKVKIRTLPQGTTSSATFSDTKSVDDSSGSSISPNATEGPVGELMQLITEYRQDPKLLASLQDHLAELDRKLPDEIKKSIGWQSEEFFKTLLDDVQDILLDQLPQAK